jgi:ferredoxin-thioredoxin reductase catalytic subunit
MNGEVEKLYKKLDREAESSGYHLNPDKEHTLWLVEGLIKNEKRYGYWACPCRLADGKKEEDLDIICPCDYRDPDLSEYGTCYCGLYVSQRFLDDKTPVPSIPEKRPEEAQIRKAQPQKSCKIGVTVWRCRVCGYLCAREKPPEVCPICKAKKERFEKFII